MNNIDKLRQNERILNHLDIMEKKLNINYIPVGLLEFHPYDKCPLSCLFCTYHKDKSDVFGYENLEKLKIFNPRAIVISGGGEPVYYKDGKYKFDDLIKKIREMFPKAQLGLTSNGQFVPQGDWYNEFDWIRISIDTNNERTFKIIKDGKLSSSINSLKQMIGTPIKHVGAGFVYSRFNIWEIYDFLRMIYTDVYLNTNEKDRDKLNVQFRPTCMVQSCNCPSDSYKSTGQLMVPDEKDWWQEYVELELKKIFVNSDIDFQRFVLEHSNLNRDTLFKLNNSKPTFTKCWNSLARILVRANGDLYPCVMRACNSSKPIANILNCNNPNMIYYNQMLYHNLCEGYCDGADSCCRLDGQKNEIVDKYVKETGFKKIKIRKETGIDYFF